MAEVSIEVAARAIANAMQHGSEEATAREARWLVHLIETNGECGCFLTRCEECMRDDACEAWLATVKQPTA